VKQKIFLKIVPYIEKKAICAIIDRSTIYYRGRYDMAISELMRQAIMEPIEEVRKIDLVISMILCFIITFSLVGCGNKEQEKRDHTESLMLSETIGTIQETQDRILETSEFSKDKNDPEKDVEQTDHTGNEVRALSKEEIEEAKQAALDYYANTVFEVNSIQYMEVGNSLFSEGDCIFSVKVSKGGVVQEPDRIISLKKNDNTWEIIGEGY
jgi:uncharacterized lipoprotein YehR (DUF1307 family)